jgi:hypothetical protein
MTQLQQLQKSDPARYQQVTQQIAANLEDAAKTAQSQGNSAAAAKLNQLASEFSDASKTGQLPGHAEVAKALGSGHHHHHGGGMHPVVPAFSTDTDASGSLDPVSIIGKALS